VINLKDRVLASIVFFTGIVLPVMLTACMGVPVSYSEEEDQFEREIEQLIGSNTVDVEQKLGHPTSRIRLYDSTVFIYARVAEANVLDLMIPVATYKNMALLCYNLLFDANGQLAELEKNWYDISDFGYPVFGPQSPRGLCQKWISSKYYLFEAFGKQKWSLNFGQQYDPKVAPIPQRYYECNFEEEQMKRESPVYWKQVKYLWSASDEELLAAAESGNPEARLQLYWNNNRELGMYWLCRSANQGYPKARYRIAQLYEFGDDGIDKNLLSAYLWYDLAAKACHPWSRKDAIRISSELLSEDDRRDATRMIEQWSPLDCKNWACGPEGAANCQINIFSTP
jgi:TPR repeat protein